MTLPKGWINCNLEDVNIVIAGQSPESKFYNENGDGLPFFQGKADFGQLYPTNRVYCTEPKKLAEDGDILLSVRAPVGPTNIARETVGIGRGLNAIRPLGGILTRYVLYYFKQIEPVFSGSGTGTTFSAVTVDAVKNLTFPLPPLAEQHRIVTKIDALFSELDKGAEVLQTVRHQLRRYRQAVLKWAFDREGFSYRPLSELGDLGRGKSKHRPRNDPRLFKDGKYPFLQTGEVKAANGKIKEYTAMYGDYGLAQSKLWPVGTLCITIAANIAETAFLAIEACFPDSVVGFTANEDLVVPKYVDLFIQSAKQRLWYYAPATAQKNINLNTLENLIVPYCPKPEQERLVAVIESRLSVCDKLEQLVDENLAKTQALRQSILKKAFAGQLVPQDPNDEPAEKLLERIKAMKAAATPQAKLARRKHNG